MPTTGGVSAVAYSSVAVPFGFPKQKSKWQVTAVYNVALPNTNITAIGTWAALLAGLNVPIGSWSLSYQASVYFNSTASGVRSGFYTIATAAPTNNVIIDPFLARVYASGAGAALSFVTKTLPVDTTVATQFSSYATVDTASGTESVQLLGNATFFIAENAYL